MTRNALKVTFQYPKFLAVYENRQYNSNSLINHGYGILFHGKKGTMFLDRAGNMEHWANFLDCMKTWKIVV